MKCTLSCTRPFLRSFAHSCTCTIAPPLVHACTCAQSGTSLENNRTSGESVARDFCTLCSIQTETAIAVLESRWRGSMVGSRVHEQCRSIDVDGTTRRRTLKSTATMTLLVVRCGRSTRWCGQTETDRWAEGVFITRTESAELDNVSTCFY